MISLAQPADGPLRARTRHCQGARGAPCEGLSRDGPVGEPPALWVPMAFTAKQIQDRAAPVTDAPAVGESIYTPGGMPTVMLTLTDPVSGASLLSVADTVMVCGPDRGRSIASSRPYQCPWMVGYWPVFR